MSDDFDEEVRALNEAEEQQSKISWDKLAGTVGHYFWALRREGVPTVAATALAAQLQSDLIASDDDDDEELEVDDDPS